MNKKIVLLLIIACIISAIAFKVLAGPAGGSGLVGPICSNGGTATTGNITTANVSVNTAAFSTSTISLTITCANSTCYNSSITNLVIMNDTVNKTCDPYSTEYLAQNITGNFTNVTNVQVSAASPIKGIATVDAKDLIAFGFNVNNQPIYSSKLVPNYGSALKSQIVKSPIKAKLFEKDNQILVATVGKTSDNHPVFGMTMISTITGLPTAADFRQANTITLGAGYTVDMGTPLIAAAGNCEDGDCAYGEYVIVFAKIRTGTGNPVKSDTLSFKIDTLLNTVTLVGGQLTEYSASPSDAVLTGLTQAYMTSLLTEVTPGYGYYAWNTFTGYISDGRVLVSERYTDNVPKSSGTFTVQPVSLDTLEAFGASYAPDSSTGAVSIIAASTATRTPYSIRIGDWENPTLSISTQTMGGFAADACIIGTDEKSKRIERICYDDTAKTTSKTQEDKGGNIAPKREDKRVDTLAEAFADAIHLQYTSVLTMFTSTNSSQLVIYRSTTGDSFQSSVLESNFVGDSLAPLGTSSIAEGNAGSWVNFVIAGRSPNNSSILLGYFNTSMEAYAINPNGTMRFTADKWVGIETLHPDINILNFRLTWQNFTGTFDTSAGTCTGCQFDLGNGTCQAEVEKVFGMFATYNLTINLTPNKNLNFTALNMLCRDGNATVAAHPNCAGLFSKYPTGITSGPCMTWINSSIATTFPGGLSINIKNLTTTGAQFNMGTLTPTPTCEMIACEINGTWEAGDTQDFVLNKTIKVTAN